MPFIKPFFPVLLVLALITIAQASATKPPISPFAHRHAQLSSVVRDKCSDIARKSRKSFAEILYQKLRCKPVKITKPKLKKQSKPRKTTIAKGPKKPKIINIPKKPKKPSILKKPKFPKLNKPKLPKMKPKKKLPKMKPKKKLPKMKSKKKLPKIQPKKKLPNMKPKKLPKIQLKNKPKLPVLPKMKPKKLPKLPVLPKMKPKKLPKVPVLPKMKPKKLPKLPVLPKMKPNKRIFPWKKKKSSNNSKSNNRTKKKTRSNTTSQNKKTVQTINISPTPSRTPSPSPRAPSPSPSLTKLKDALESAKKRLLNNIQKHEQQAEKPSRCTTENYTCGRKCSGRPGPRFLCHYPNLVPRFCVRKTSRMEFCQRGGEKRCFESVMQPHVCMRNVSVTEYCPGAEEGCRFSDIPFGRCLPDECDRLRKKRCEYNRRKIVAPCEEPSNSCHDCKSSFITKHCPKTVKQRVTVPCPGEKSLPTFDEELLGNGIESSYVRDILCFDSFFDESVCDNSPRVCRMFDEMFDRHLCAGVICQECAQLMSMHVSEQVKDVCKNLLQGSCTAAGQFLDTEETTDDDDEEKCYGTKTVEKMLPCYEQLPRDKICSKGCVVKSCKKTIHEVKGYCERNLPERCMKADAMGCRRETKRVMDCSDERICEYVVKKPYLCFREKQVEVPCEGGCEVLKDERYVCGSEEEEVEAVCREQFDHSCRDMVCSREVCR